MKLILFAFFLIPSFFVFGQNHRPLVGVKTRPGLEKQTHSPFFHHPFNKYITSDVGNESLTLSTHPPMTLSVEHLVDSAYRYLWDTTANGWILVARERDYVRNPQGALLGYLLQKQAGNQWADSARLSYTVNDHQIYTSETKELWSGNSWTNDSRVTITYNNDDYWLSQTVESWNGTGWDTTDVTLVTYDAYNAETSRKSLTSTLTGTLEIYDQDLYTNNPDHKRTSAIKQYWENNAWENNDKDTLLYDGQGNYSGQTQFFWISNAWQTSRQYVNTYNNNHLLINTLVTKWQGNQWVPESKDTLTYDAAGNRTARNTDRYVAGVWQNYFRRPYTYDLNNNVTSFYTYRWNGTRWLYVLSDNFRYAFDSLEVDEGFKFYNFDDANKANYSDSVHYFLGTFTETLGSKTPAADLTLYPNPVSDRFHIRSAIAISGVEILDLLGRRVLSISESQPINETAINLSMLPKGIYSARIWAGGRLFTRQVVRE